MANRSQGGSSTVLTAPTYVDMVEFVVNVMLGAVVTLPISQAGFQISTLISTPTPCTTSVNRSHRPILLLQFLHPRRRPYKSSRHGRIPRHLVQHRPPSLYPSARPSAISVTRLAMVPLIRRETRAGRRYVLRLGWLWKSPRSPPICAFR